jgi:hypothetical protein
MNIILAFYTAAGCYGTRSPLQDLTRIIKITYSILMPH